jgi:type IV pilus assembly protein PilZ
MELPDGTTRAGLATDVSLGGVFVETDEPPSFGSKVVVVCPLGDGGASRLDAVVRWGKPGGVGLQFGLLGARDTHALAQFVKRHGA